MTRTVARPQERESAPSEQQELWYAPDRRIETAQAANQAIATAEAIARRDDDAMGELELFTALHTCAYQSARADRAGDEHRAHLWHERWSIVREHLVKKNLGLVHLMIKRYRSAELDEDDLLSDGMFGLVRAVEKFNPWRGYRLSTYACNVIARALMRRAKTTGGYHRHFPVQQDVALEKPVRSADNNTELCVERLQHILSRNLGALTELESMILARRFPPHGPQLTYQQIGKGVGLSKERVRQIQNVALCKLRGVLSADPILK